MATGQERRGGKWVMGSKESTYHDGKRKRKASGEDRSQAVVFNAVINSSDGHSGLYDHSFIHSFIHPFISHHSPASSWDVLHVRSPQSQGQIKGNKLRGCQSPLNCLWENAEGHRYVLLISQATLFLCLPFQMKVLRIWNVTRMSLKARGWKSEGRCPGMQAGISRTEFLLGACILLCGVATQSPSSSVASVSWSQTHSTRTAFPPVLPVSSTPSRW